MDDTRIVLSIDVEEHFRIEAAAGLRLAPALEAEYAARVEVTVAWLLGELQETGAQATFFVLGELARQRPALVRAIHGAGHEVASHGWNHRRLHHLCPDSFREDVRRSTDALEQATGAAVVGYRAPTFSIVRQTAWAIDVLSELGMLYDSSIQPIWHDRYGVPDAPRWPFRLRGERHTLLEFPLATWRIAGGVNLPVGGGGYFRLLPLWALERALRQVRRDGRPAAATLYFHPWEFDPGQPRLPLRRANYFRTYVGMATARARFRRLLLRHRFTRAIDLARQLQSERLESFTLGFGRPTTPGGERPTFSTTR